MNSFERLEELAKQLQEELRDVKNAPPSPLPEPRVLRGEVDRDIMKVAINVGRAWDRVTKAQFYGKPTRQAYRLLEKSLDAMTGVLHKHGRMPNDEDTTKGQATGALPPAPKQR